jgi:tRNA threonylcarbamoyladenosine biosynthesis protein TsaE
LIHRIHNEQETMDLARDFSKQLTAGSVVALSGDLGAGKSVFARALMRALGVTDAVMPSPTFAIVQEYAGRDHRIAHMDWYRLGGTEELEAIGVHEYMQPPWICVIEWPERADSLVPPTAHRLHITMVPGQVQARDIEITAAA